MTEHEEGDNLQPHLSCAKKKGLVDIGDSINMR